MRSRFQAWCAVLLTALVAPGPAAAEGASSEAAATAFTPSAPTEAEAYAIEPVETPEGAVLEVGGLAFAPDGTLFVCTRRGEVWARRSFKAKRGGGTWARFAEGLAEPLGLLAISAHEVLVAQRPELTRLRDTNKDGAADAFETVTAAFGVSGNFHEYHFGPVADKAGNLYGTLNVGWLAHADSSVPYRGWAYKVTRDGRFVPLASGLRSPAGIGMSPEDELFVTDNQGDWWPTSPLIHVQPNRFYANPAGLRWEANYQGPQDSYDTDPEVLLRRRTLPALWFVYGPLGHSPTEPVWDTTKGTFGPFAGQIFVGDQTRSQITRVALEKVGGVYQGAAIPFRTGLASGITRMAFGPDDSLYVGGTDRGWGAVGGKPYALERVRFTGVVPFDILTVNARPDGFVVRFTQPVREASMSKDAVSIVHHGYRYWRNYGSPHVDTTTVEPLSVTPLEDGRAWQVRLPELQRGKVYSFKFRGLQNEAGAPLLHAEAYYTLNQIPKSEVAAGEGGK